MKFSRIAAFAFPAFALLAAAPAAPRYAVMQRIAGPDGGWDLVSVDPARRRLLVAHGDAVTAVDLRTGAVTPQFVSGARFHIAFAIPGTRLGIATSGSANKAILFDASTGAVTGEVPTGANPDDAIYEPASKTVWVMNARDGSATIVDPKAAKAVATVAIGGALEGPALDGRGHLFVNIEDKNEIAEVDLVSRKVIKHIALTGCDGPTGLAYLSSGVLVSACANGVAKLVRAATGTIAGEIAIGPRPDGAFADPARRRAYIPSGGDGSLTVLDTSGPLPRAIARIPTQKGARTGTVDPETGRVYLPTARFDPPAAPGQRPKAIPGSFEILVVAGR
jgi:DNA-binding beta-propeller fold protein YncE